MVSISWPRDPPASASQSAGIIGVSHRAQPLQNIKGVKKAINETLPPAQPVFNELKKTLAYIHQNTVLPLGGGITDGVHFLLCFSVFSKNLYNISVFLTKN